jgi:hypothetical protein
MRLFARNSIEVGKMEQYVISPVIPQRAHFGSETQFSRRQLVSRGSSEEASASGRGQQQQAEHIIQLCRFAMTRNGMTVFLLGACMIFLHSKCIADPETPASI